MSIAKEYPLICGEEMAKMAQLMMEYHPEPQFNAGTPATADRAIVKQLLQFGKPLVAAFAIATQTAAERLKTDRI